MLRISYFVTLILFILVVSWPCSSLQQELSPLKTEDPGEQSLYTTPPPHLMERTFPQQNKASESSPEILPPVNDKAIKEIPSVQKNGKDIPQEEFCPEPFLDEFLPLRTQDAIHFLLLGRKTDSPRVKMAMIVSLIPGTHARITAFAPGTTISLNGEKRTLSDILNRNGYNGLCRAMEDATGLRMHFYVELDLDGFTEMVDILGGVDYDVSEATARKHGAYNPGLQQFDGDAALSFLKDDRITAGAKETFLVKMLIAARDINNTRRGISLLWKGYHSIKTDLSLSDLLEVRKITQKIHPTRVSYRETP